jgi:hypothetical protein
MMLDFGRFGSDAIASHNVDVLEARSLVWSIMMPTPTHAFSIVDSSAMVMN